MSRTKRNYGYQPKLDNYNKTWLGCLESYVYTYDPRDRLIHGYDGNSPTYYYVNYPSGGWRENYQGVGRIAAKRRWHKARRRLPIEME